MPTIILLIISIACFIKGGNTKEGIARLICAPLVMSIPIFIGIAEYREIKNEEEELKKEREALLNKYKNAKVVFK